jgi:predicted ATPase
MLEAWRREKAAASSMDSTPFGKLLRAYRLARGLSQESLAERAAMSVNGVSALERGANQTPQRKTLDLLVNALALDAQQAHALEEAARRPSRPRSSASGAIFRDLPRPSTPFVGRRELLENVTRVVMQVPLVTLTGVGGIGKTRLALKAAEELEERFADGLAFVDLAPLRDGEAVFRALSAKAVVEALRLKNLLLVIDNCEHVAPAVARALQVLIENCPGIRIVATSRQSLNVPAEQIFHVPSLEIDAAVELFTERAKRAVGRVMFSPTDNDAIARIVTRLDGIALAIELAAARMNVLTLPELEQHLSERFNILSGGSTSMLPRHQTLRATMDWSYDVLDSRDRLVFVRLGVFPGSFSLDGAVAVCGDDQMGKWQVFEALASLVDKSLALSAPDGNVQRYSLLETTRAYAVERMSDPDETAVLRRRHAFFYARLAQDAAIALESTESTTAWARALEPDLENFHTALDWMLREHGDIAAGAKLLFDLQELWIVEGFAAETARRAHDALQVEPALPGDLQAALWLTIARMRQELFVHPEETLEAASNARVLYEASGDRRGAALAMRQEAAAHMRLGAFARAHIEFQRSIEIYEELGDRRMAARGLVYLASLLQVQGEYVQARTLLLDVLRIAQAIGDDRMVPTISMNLAETEFALGEPASAVERARRNLSNEVLQKSCDMAATQEANLSVYLLALGETDESREMALASMEDAGGSFTAVPLQHLAASVAYADPISAAKILGYVDEAFKNTAFSREFTERFSYDYLTAALQDAIDERESATYRREGAAMSEREILALAYQAAPPIAEAPP